MKAGDSVFDAYGGGVAHRFDREYGGVATMTCGHRIKASMLVSNRGRRKPCARCAAALERMAVK